MPRTELRSAQIKDATIGRADLDVATPGSAVVAKIVAGSGITLSQTGADTGTGDVTVTASGGGSGNVVGPASASDNALVRFDTTTGKLIQNSTALLDDAGLLSLTGDLTVLNADTKIKLQGTGTTVSRLFKPAGGDYTDLGLNLTFGSGAWSKDDTAKEATLLQMQLGSIGLYGWPAGGALTQKFTLDTVNAGLTQTGAAAALPVKLVQAVTGTTPKARHMFFSGAVTGQFSVNADQDGAGAWTKDDSNTDATVAQVKPSSFEIWTWKAPGGNWAQSLATDNNSNLLVGNTLLVWGQIALRSDPVIRTNSADGADNAYLHINGGGGVGPTRGASLQLHGNEHASPGHIYLDMGNAGTAALYVRNGSFTSLLVLGNTGHFQTYGYVYPGRFDAPNGVQGNWYLATHGSYGLYTNTGLYVSGSVWLTSAVWMSGSGNFDFNSSGYVNLNQHRLYHATLTHYQEYIATLSIASGWAYIDLNASNLFDIYVTSACSFQFQNPGYAQSFTVLVHYGGNYALTWPSNVRWPNDVTPTPSTSGYTDIFSFISRDGGSIWLGTVVQKLRWY